jgi:hypothetical protein
MGTARFLEGLALDRSEVATSPMAHDEARKINFKTEPTSAAVGADKNAMEADQGRRGVRIFISGGRGKA